MRYHDEAFTWQVYRIYDYNPLLEQGEETVSAEYLESHHHTDWIREKFEPMKHQILSREKDVRITVGVNIVYWASEIFLNEPLYAARQDEGGYSIWGPMHPVPLTKQEVIDWYNQDEFTDEDDPYHVLTLEEFMDEYFCRL